MAWTPGSLWGQKPRQGPAPLAVGREPIAIEFRGGHARLLQLQANRDRPVRAAACVAWDRAKPGDAADAIVAAIRGGGFREGRCVVGLPYAFARAETLAVPDGDDITILDDLLRRSPWRFGFAEPELGLLRLGDPEEGRVEVAVVIANRARIERLADALLDRGVVPDAAEPSFVSVARACSQRHRRAGDRDHVRIAVDLHEDGAVAMLLAGDRIVHCTSLEERDGLAGAIAVCMHDGAPHAGGLPTEIRLAGLGADDASLRATLEAACGIPVRVAEDDVGRAWRAIRDAIGVRGDPAGDVAAWAGALGLAERNVPEVARRQRSAA